MKPHVFFAFILSLSCFSGYGSENSTPQRKDNFFYYIYEQDGVTRCDCKICPNKNKVSVTTISRHLKTDHSDDIRRMLKNSKIYEDEAGEKYLYGNRQCYFCKSHDMFSFATTCSACTSVSRKMKKRKEPANKILSKTASGKMAISYITNKN